MGGPRRCSDSRHHRALMNPHPSSEHSAQHRCQGKHAAASATPGVPPASPPPAHQLTLDDTFSSREQINAELLGKVQRDCERWGVCITRCAARRRAPPAVPLLGLLQAPTLGTWL